MSRIVIEANNPTGGQRAAILGVGGGENIDGNRLQATIESCITNKCN